MPPEVAEQISRDQAAPQPNYTDVYAKLSRDDWTLRFCYEGEMVAGRSTAEGVDVLAVGPEEVLRFFKETLAENRPYDFQPTSSLLPIRCRVESFFAAFCPVCPGSQITTQARLKVVVA